MAGLTEMGITPTKPLGDGAAEFAFVFDEIHPVRFAIFHPTSHAYSCALTTHQLLFFEILIVVLSCFAIFHAAEVRVVAFVALII